MRTFIDQDFLLNTEYARKLYHEAAAQCPIIDYHCHISPKEIWENRQYDNMTQVWLGGDHYKWRLMRAAGVPEELITGSAPDKDKFMAWAKVLGKAIGNPLYQWSHLELRRFFGYQGILNEKTAEEVWEFCNAKLRTPEFAARGLIGMSNVEAICTTDDPADTLEYHELIKADKTFNTTVLPAWRPDQATGIEKPGFIQYMEKLGTAADIKIDSFASLKSALIKRLDFFAAHGCSLSDHALVQAEFEPCGDEKVEEIFAKRMAGDMPSEQELRQYHTEMMLFLGAEYARRGWVMQLHFAAQRNNNPSMFEKLGPDTGYDSMSNKLDIAKLSAFMGALESKGALPKTVLYSLNDTDNAMIDSLCNCFQSAPDICKVQHGSAWWFNDHFDGMVDQLKSYASSGYLAGFVGMLTDSRSFLSYPRHEYFRRILCRVIGEWVEQGMYPEDLDTLKEIVRGVCYENTKRYFGF